MHPLIASFPIREYPTNSGYCLYYTGMKYRRYFMNFDLQASFPATEPLLPVFPSPPIMDHSYVEYIPIFEAIEDCTGKFTMIDLGAGSGSWSTHAACIARAKGIITNHILVEAEPRFFASIKDCIHDNGVPDERCVYYEAAVIGAENGKEAAEFPLVVWHSMVPANWFGQYAIRIRDPHKIHELSETYYGRKVYLLADLMKFIFVPTVTLNRILETHGKVNLVIMDIQGEEARVIRGAKSLLTTHVGMVGIETHGEDIHNEIKEIFADLGWEKIVDHREGNINKHDYFDEYLSYRNPYFQQ